MAEAFLKKYGGESFEAEISGLESGKMNPRVIEVMKEEGIDLTQKGTQEFLDLFGKRKTYDAIVTVCDGANAERCPVFPGDVKRIA